MSGVRSHYNSWIDVFRFTLYWTLIFHVPLYTLVGIYAFLNVLFPPTRRRVAFFAFDWARRGRDGEDGGGGAGGAGGEHIPLDPRRSLRRDAAHDTPALPRSSVSSLHRSANADDGRRQPRPRLNVRRTRLTFALVVFFAFVVLSVFSAVSGAAIMGFVIAGVYKAGGFWVSTCVFFFLISFHTCIVFAHLILSFHLSYSTEWLTNEYRWVPFIWAVIHGLVGLLGCASISHTFCCLYTNTDVLYP